jgi:hypothetical protein
VFCNSDSCESAIGLSERPPRPSIMEIFYSLYSPLPLFTRVRGRGSSEVPTRGHFLNSLHQ